MGCSLNSPIFPRVGSHPAESKGKGDHLNQNNEKEFLEASYTPKYIHNTMLLEFLNLNLVMDFPTGGPSQN